MQIVNPLRAALPYITLQTAKVQRCWADYFIFRGFAGAAGGWACGPRPGFFASPKKPDKNPLTLLQIIPRWYIILP